MRPFGGRLGARPLCLGRETLRLERWLPLYREICDEFGFDESEDRASATFLSSILGERGSEAFDAFSASRLPETAVLCGGGDSLASDISSLSERDYIVAADGATSLVMERGLLPDVIVTDLDGVIEDQVEANARGSIIFVHAHGDNREALATWVPEFSGRIVGTCQCEPVGRMFNFGGFTDGDRAACVLAELGVKRILLAGFDLEHPSRKPGRSAEVKMRKLAWAARILAMVAEGCVSIEPVVTR
ncbi:MAG: DUF115 domain-containing protein [Thermoplasmata archaeon]|nr:DUF115 domain-containing protein [Thermoplasmata archaeon]